MGKKEAPRDLFMQFATIRARIDVADSTVVVEEQMPTGLSIRSQLIWLVHQVEFHLPINGAAATNTLEAALATQAGLTDVPEWDTRGVIAVQARTLRIITEGGGYDSAVEKQGFLPPVPLAAPQLSFYVDTYADAADMRGEYCYCRIGYTTAPLTPEVYAEIAEVWGY